MTAYIDNNIIIYFENKSLTRNDLLKNVDNNISKFFYSAAHLQEANEMKAVNNQELKKRLYDRFNSISLLTNDNYLYTETPGNNTFKLKEKPSTVFKTINTINVSSAMKSMINIISEEQKEEFRNHIGIDIKKINNYTAKEVINQINPKMDIVGSQSLVELIEKAIDLNPKGKEYGLHNRIAGIFELLDMLGYWKDKVNDKSNYARLWDSNHTYYSTFCDYFISDDKRTRNKAKVVFEIYDIKTKVISSKGEE